MNSYDIIIKPILSEKSFSGIQMKRYTFKVAPSATKVDIKRAVEEVFGVEVAKVNTVSVKGKIKRRGATSGKRPDYKIFIDFTALCSCCNAVILFSTDVTLFCFSATKASTHAE